MEAEVLGGYPQVEQCGAAADQQGSAMAVSGAHLSRWVGVQLYSTRTDCEPPRLAVVDRRCRDGRLQHRALDLLVDEHRLLLRVHGASPVPAVRAFSVAHVVGEPGGTKVPEGQGLGPHIRHVSDVLI
jgi:hypothetical protein